MNRPWLIENKENTANSCLLKLAPFYPVESKKISKSFIHGYLGEKHIAEHFYTEGDMFRDSNDIAGFDLSGR